MTADPRGAGAAPERMHALDAVRGLALVLGVVFHAAFSFVPSRAPIWVVADSHPSLTLGIAFFSLHVFRMTTFFMIAGFFARMSLGRRGVKGFVADRLRRIAIPLVVGWPLLFAAIVAVSLWAVMSARHGAPPTGPAPAFPRFPNFPLTHLWFLYVLLELYAGALVARGAAALADRGGRARAAVDRGVAAVMATPF
ncbi:MAG: acyltransferase family protein, partial [Devosia sp.]|nr:acyltransferase family protein [Devosia sp.]